MTQRSPQMLSRHTNCLGDLRKTNSGSAGGGDKHLQARTGWQRAPRGGLQSRTPARRKLSCSSRSQPRRNIAILKKKKKNNSPLRDSRDMTSRFTNKCEHKGLKTLKKIDANPMRSASLPWRGVSLPWRESPYFGGKCVGVSLPWRKLPVVWSIFLLFTPRVLIPPPSTGAGHR